jgi:AcrR family transcriptional regulator
MTSATQRIALETIMAATTGTVVKVPETPTDFAILRAAAEVISENGERNVTIDQVAERASFTRMTVFRRFGSRDSLLLATYAHALNEVLSIVTTAAATTTVLHDRALVVFSQLITCAENNPIAQRLVQVEPAVIIGLWRGTEFAGQVWGAALISQLLQSEDVTPVIAPDEADYVGALLMRMVMSLLLAPDPAMIRSEQEREAFLRKVVARIMGSP